MTLIDATCLLRSPYFILVEGTLRLGIRRFVVSLDNVRSLEEFPR